VGWYERSPDRPILPILERMLRLGTGDDLIKFVLWFALKELNETGILATVKRTINIADGPANKTAQEAIRRVYNF